MTISSFLDIAWTHAYWCEGPRFQALGYSNGGTVDAVPDEMVTPSGGGLVVGPLSLSVAVASTTDLAQATSTKRPIFRSSHASFNSKPILEFDGVDDAIATTQAWTTLTLSNQIFMVARARNAARVPANAGSFRAFASANHSGSQMAGMIGQDDPASGALASNFAQSNGSLVRTTKVADTVAHAFHMDQAAGGGFEIDGVSYAATIGARTSDGCILGAANNLTPGNWNACDVAFWAIKDTGFTGTELADLVALSQSHYGTP